MPSFFCTIFTPTYNRGKLLGQLYESLVSQTFKDFEWIIVDDGSTDNTKDIVYSFIGEGIINIKYIQVENGGKHRAINKGLDLADSKVFAIVDSDDYLTDKAIFQIFEWFKDIEKSNKKFCGVAGNKGYSKNMAIGESFIEDYIDATNIERKKYNIIGDKFEVFYTEILKQYKFPTFEDEKFMSEIVVWTRIAKDGYLIRWHKDVIYICEYLDGGLTANNFKLLANNPQGYALRIREQVKYGNISFKDKLGYYSNYYLFLKKKKSFIKIKKDLEANVVILFIAVVLRRMQLLLLKDDSYESI